MSLIQKTLQSAKKYFWQVWVWDNHDKSSSWSEPAFCQMGFLQSTDWNEKWIKVGYDEDTVLRHSPLFQKTFSTAKKYNLTLYLLLLMDCTNHL